MPRLCPIEAKLPILRQEKIEIRFLSSRENQDPKVRKYAEKSSNHQYPLLPILDMETLNPNPNPNIFQKMHCFCSLSSVSHISLQFLQFVIYLLQTSDGQLEV